ncbi:MAG: hypothetical protein IT369_00955 [Candidatus Latescibacteria bacterium]|nr:hypothetical protein [Candidatus Latescibacterota bacterium]
MNRSYIQVRGASDPPLQALDLDLPLGEIICLLGPDGGGARELALGVLYRESRRRYAQVLSAFERETLGGGPAAAVGQISGLPPALFLDGAQRHGQHLGAVLQVEGLLARLWQDQGEGRCPGCGGICRATTPEAAADAAIAHFGGESCLVLAPIEIGPGMVEELRRAGFLRLRIAGQVTRLDGEEVAPGEAGEVVLDRLAADQDHRGRLVEACRQARTLSRGLTLVAGTVGQRQIWLNQERSCLACGRLYPGAAAPDLVGGAGPGLNLVYRGWDWRELATKNLDQVLGFLDGLEHCEGLRRPLAAATALGLGSLELGRSPDHLSTGERHLLQLAWCLGLGLTGILFVLENPGRGLDPRGQEALAAGLLRLVALGNTALVLGQNPALLAVAGVSLLCEGGQVSLGGPPAAPPPARRGRRSLNRWLRVRHGAGEWRLPLGALVCLTGPTGGGKSTLWRQVLLPGLQARRGGPVAVEGRPGIQRASVLGTLPGPPDRILLDHLGAFPGVAAQYAESSAVRDQGYPKEWFMLDRPGGRCPACEGKGALFCELEFCDDVTLVCPACEGNRYRPEALLATWRGLNLAQVLALTIGAAAHHFRGVPQVGEVLQAAQGCGLGHRRLGEPARRLGPAEGLRLQLAAELRRAGGRELVVLEHPEAGGDPGDLRLLVQILDEMAQHGTSLLIETHHPYLIGAADWLIEVKAGQPPRSVANTLA